MSLQEDLWGFRGATHRGFGAELSRPPAKGRLKDMPRFIVQNRGRPERFGQLVLYRRALNT